MQDIEHLLYAFRRDDELLDRTWVLDGKIPLDELHRLLGADADDPFLIFEYEVRSEHADRLESAIGEALDFQAFDYYVGGVRRSG